MDDEKLKYIIRDCFEAIRAYPENPKTEIYLQTARTSQLELDRRELLRITRRELRRYLFDPLNHRDVRDRRRIRERNQIQWARNLWLDACWRVGYNRLTAR